MDRCRVEEPPALDVGDGRAAACWLQEGATAPRRPAEAAAALGQRVA
jgi:peptide/nickel transport system ATP-binding protein